MNKECCPACFTPTAGCVKPDCPCHKKYYTTTRPLTAEEFKSLKDGGVINVGVEEIKPTPPDWEVELDKMWLKETNYGEDHDDEPVKSFISNLLTADRKAQKDKFNEMVDKMIVKDNKGDLIDDYSQHNLALMELKTKLNK